jgi:hypothetical protein
MKPVTSLKQRSLKPKSYLSTALVTFDVRLSLLLQVIAVEVHDLVPGSQEVLHEPLFRIVAGVDFRQRAELRVGRVAPS